MSLSEFSVEGTLMPDGTLELDHKPSLAPGRVTVLLRQTPEVTVPSDDWLQCLQRLRADREASGYPFMNEVDLNVHLAWLREADRIDELLQSVSDQRLPEQP
jgi:hypothetical protein